MALPNYSLSSCQVPPWSLGQSYWGWPHTCACRQAPGRHPAPGSRPHETFTARCRQGNSRLPPWPSLGKRDISSLLGTQREDEDPNEVVLGATLPSTCHLGLIHGQARTVRWGGSAPLSRAAFWNQVSPPAPTTSFAGQKGKGLGGLRTKTSCLLLQEYFDILVGPLHSPSLRNQR